MGVKEVKIGLLTIAGLVVGYFGFNYLKGNSVLNNGTIVYSSYTNVEGLHVGSKVVVNGFTIGKVKGISLGNTNGEVMLVEYIIDNKNLQIPKNSIGEVVSVDLFGSKAINIVIGSGTEMIQSGDTLLSKDAGGMFDMVEERISPYQERVDHLINDLDTLLANLKTVSSNVNKLMVSQSPKIDALSSNLVSITQNLENNNESINRTLANLESVSDSLNAANIKEVVANANNALLSMNATMNKINQGQGTLGKLVNDSALYQNLNASTKALEVLLRDMEENPKKYVHFSVFGRKDKEEKESSKK